MIFVVMILCCIFHEQYKVVDISNQGVGGRGSRAIHPPNPHPHSIQAPLWCHSGSCDIIGRRSADNAIYSWPNSTVLPLYRVLNMVVK